MAKVNFMVCDKCGIHMETAHRHLHENNGFGHNFDFCKPCWLKFVEWLRT